MQKSYKKVFLIAFQYETYEVYFNFKTKGMIDMSDTVARSYFEKAKVFDDYKAKAKYLKMAYNSADSYSLKSEITSYALLCGIDLDKVSGYDY